MPHAIPRPWTSSDLKRMRQLARKRMSARLAAKELRRTPGAVKFKAMTLGIRFRAINQPRGTQCTVKQRRALSRIATARYAEARKA